MFFTFATGRIAAEPYTRSFIIPETGEKKSIQVYRIVTDTGEPIDLVLSDDSSGVPKDLAIGKSIVCFGAQSTYESPIDQITCTRIFVNRNGKVELLEPLSSSSSLHSKIPSGSVPATSFPALPKVEGRNPAPSPTPSAQDTSSARDEAPPATESVQPQAETSPSKKDDNTEIDVQEDLGLTADESEPFLQLEAHEQIIPEENTAFVVRIEDNGLVLLNNDGKEFFQPMEHVDDFSVGQNINHNDWTDVKQKALVS